MPPIVSKESHARAQMAGALLLLADLVRQQRSEVTKVSVELRADGSLLIELTRKHKPVAEPLKDGALPGPGFQLRRPAGLRSVVQRFVPYAEKHEATRLRSIIHDALTSLQGWTTASWQGGS